MFESSSDCLVVGSSSVVHSRQRIVASSLTAVATLQF